MHDLSKLFGVATGVAVAVFLWALFVSLRNKRSGDAPQFDERQLAARAKAYSSAFFTLLGYLAVVAVLDSVAEVHWCDLYTACFLGMMLALDVFAVTAIRSDAYFGIHERPVASIVLFAFVAVLNLGVADAVGVSRQTIVAIEKGDYNPTIRLCICICQALGCTLDALFWPEPDR